MRFSTRLGILFLFIFSYQVQAQKIEDLLKKAQQMMKEDQYDSCLFLANKAELLCEEGDEMALIKALELQITSYDNMYMPNEMIPPANKLLSVAKANHQQADMAHAYNYLGNAYGSLREIEKAYKCYSKALEIGKEIPSKEIQATELDNIALLYCHQQQYEKARVLFFENLELLTDTADAKSLAGSYNNIGITYFYDENDNLNMALKWFLKADSVINTDPSVSESYRLVIKIGIAATYGEQSEYDKAKKIYMDVLENAIKIKYRIGELRCYSGLSEIYSNNQPDKSFDFLLLLYRKSVEYKLYDEQKKAVEKLRNYYEDKEDFKSAFFYAKELESIADSMNITDINSITERSKLATELKEKEFSIKQLKAQNRYNELKDKVYLIIVIGLIIMGIIVFIAQKAIINKNKRIAYEQKKRIEEQNHSQQLEIEKQAVELNASREKLMYYINLQITKNKISSEIRRKASLSESNSEELNDILSSKILTREDWREFKDRYESVYPNFIYYLKKSHPKLTEAEQRLFILIRLNLSTEDIANVLGISLDSVWKSRTRLRIAMQLNANNELDEYILNFRGAE